MTPVKDLPEAQYSNRYKISEASTNPILCAMLTPLTFNRGYDFDFIVRDLESGVDYKCKFSSLLRYLEDGMIGVNESSSEVMPEVIIKECIGNREVTTTIKGSVEDIKKLMEGLHE